jgi:hypothetical protein
MTGIPYIEIIIILCAIFSLIAGIIGLDLPLVRDIIAILFILYGLFHFPYSKEDRFVRPGLATSCVIFILSGVFTFFFESWWLIPIGVLLGYLIIPKMLFFR